MKDERDKIIAASARVDDELISIFYPDMEGFIRIPLEDNKLKIKEFKVVKLNVQDWLEDEELREKYAPLHPKLVEDPLFKLAVVEAYFIDKSTVKEKIVEAKSIFEVIDAVFEKVKQDPELRKQVKEAFTGAKVKIRLLDEDKEEIAKTEFELGKGEL
ncbi:hypothetical protein [Thermococcus sp. LS2]|uniref:hypothetical protein n=1 Tax=Thermococcus sp. LS2 TaxID=1638260 RepID=UPI001439E8DF|nr:hypothetical protein [Thermococcus sp. LS2]NJE13744.1 hypothetical protein [Thermococcus sp. LS2]